jgi:hypothetical protein
MAVSTRAWSCLDSVTYPRPSGLVLVATRAARGRDRKGAVMAAFRLADRNAQDARLDMIAMKLLCAVAWARQKAKARGAERRGKKYFWRAARVLQQFVMAELRLGHSVISVLMGPLIGWNWPARGGGLLQPGQGQLKGAWGNRESDPEAGLHGGEI